MCTDRGNRDWSKCLSDFRKSESYCWNVSDGNRHGRGEVEDVQLCRTQTVIVIRANGSAPGMARRMSIEVAVNDSGPVPRLVSFMFRRMDMSDGGQQGGQHEREDANNRGGRTHDVSIARSYLIVNQLCVWAGLTRGRVGGKVSLLELGGESCTIISSTTYF